MTSDVLIIGSGISGLFTALMLARERQVTVVTKGKISDSASCLAQGGIASAVGAGDAPALHAKDTISAGHGMSDREAVDVLTRAGPACIQELLSLGVRFDTLPDGQFALATEASHSVPRILRCGGDQTGAAVMEALIHRATEHPNITICENTFVTELAVHSGRCKGAWVLQRPGRLVGIAARVVVLATGGAGQLYSYTTNPPVCTGDGIAMASDVKVALKGMEFIQFHPTALKGKASPLFLISEAVRGEGAVLIDDRGERFVEELAPRDVVARAVYQKLAAGRQVYLDATHLGGRFADRFPAIYEACSALGIDPRCQPMPVTPAAHYTIGGVSTDTWGRTSLPGLYAVGEAAHTGVHGANRLASNSLLEGLVFGWRVSRRIAAEPEGSPLYLPDPRVTATSWSIDAGGRAALQKLLWEKAGIIRTRAGLSEAARQLEQMDCESPDLELRNMIRVSRLIVEAALGRNTSIGAHYIVS